MVEEYRIEQMPELINKIKTAIDTANLIKSAKGNPIEITDGSDAPLVKCVIQITGYQQGSGKPSPDNVRPIVAYTEGEIEVMGRNLAFSVIENADINSSGEIVTNRSFKLYIAMVKKDTDYIVHKGTDYKIMAFYETIPSLGSVSYNSARIVGQISESYYKITAPIDGFIAYRTLSSYTEGMIEEGSIATTYEPYKGTTHTTTYPSAIYRGSEDLVGGTVTTEWGMIASYAGETLPGEWISDRDEYAPGTTPTIGANVAYELAEPVTVDITVTNVPVESLYGFNKIGSTSGDLDIEYFTSKFQPLVDLVNDAGKVVYSTNERAIGTWTDGSIVYEKTIVSEQALTDTWANYAATTGMDVIVSVDPRYTRDSEEVPGSFSDTEMASWIHRDGYIKVCTPTDSADWKIESMTIRYTKSS